MWGRKSGRIAELEARNDLLAHQMADLRETANAWEWAAHRESALVAEQDRQRRITRDATRRTLARARQHTEWLTDQLVTALGYPEAALGVAAPEVTA